MPAHRSFSVGGSIARRPSPGRNCRRARRATAGPVVIAILTPRSQEPPMDFNAKRQRPKDAKAITIAQYPCANDRTCACWTQLFLLRSLSVLLFKVSGCGFSPCAFAPWRLGVFTFASKSPGPKCLYRVPFQLLSERHCDPLQIQNILKNPNDCCYLRPFATSCRPLRKNSSPANLSRQRLGDPRVQSGAHLLPLIQCVDSNRFPLFSPFSTLFPALCRLDQNTQPITPKPLATKSDGTAISKTFQLLTLFWIFPRFYERQVRLSHPSTA